MQARNGDLVYANDAAARLVGFESASEFLATPVAEVVGRSRCSTTPGIRSRSSASPVALP